MSGRRWTRRLVAALGVGAFFAAGCSPTAPPPPTRIRVSAQRILSHAPLFIALADGDFAAQGLAVEIVPLRLTKGGIAALAKGEVDVSVGYLSAALFNSMSRGARIQIVADKGQVPGSGCSAEGVVARRSLVASGALGDPRRVRGLRVALTPGTTKEYYVDRLLGAAGLGPEDIQVVSVPAAAELESLRQGAVDLVVTSEPSIARIEVEGAGELWMPAHRIAPGFQQGLIFFGPNLLDKDPDAGRRFMVAYLRAVRRYNRGKTDRNVEIVAQYTGLAPEIVRRACWETIRDDGRINARSVSDFQEWARRRGYLDATTSEDQFWNPAFVGGAARILDGAGEARR